MHVDRDVLARVERARVRRVSTTGHLIVVLGLSIGAAVDRSCTLLVTLRLAGEDCHTTTTAATSAHSTANSRNLVAIATPSAAAVTPLGECSGAWPPARRVNENLF